MNKVLLIAALVLSGCCTTPKLVQPEPVVVKQTEYVIRVPPADLMTLPAQVPNIDVDHATQGDVAAWLLQNEKRTKALEDALKGIAAFFVSQQGQLESTAKVVNTQAVQAGIAATQANAAAVATKPVDLTAAPK